MAKTYRTATEKDIAKGKGKSTDELSLAEATAYFNKRSAETGAKKFRYKGEVYDLSGNKAAAKTAAPKPSAKAADDKPMRPKARPAAPDKVVNTVRPEVPQTPKKAKGPSMSGKGGGGADKMPATGIAARRAQQEMSDKAKKVAAGAAAIGAAVVGTRAAMKGAPKAPRSVAKPTVSNPSYKGGSKMKEGFQGKMETGVGRPGATPRAAGGGRLGGSVKPRLGGGGQAAMIDKALNPFNFSKGGMATKGKK